MPVYVSEQLGTPVEQQAKNSAQGFSFISALEKNARLRKRCLKLTECVTLITLKVFVVKTTRNENDSLICNSSKKKNHTAASNRKLLI